MAVDYAKQIGFKGQFLHRAEAEGADEAPVRLRRRQRHRLPAHLRAREALQVQHRDEPRDARRPHLPARDRGGGGAGHARLDRRERGRPAPRLGHRPVQHRREGADARDDLDPARRRPRHGRLQLRRQAAPALDRSRGPLLRAHRRHGRLRPGLQDRAQDPRRRQARRRSSPTATRATTPATARRSRRARSASASWRSSS